MSYALDFKLPPTHFKPTLFVIDVSWLSFGAYILELKGSGVGPRRDLAHKRPRVEGLHTSLQAFQDRIIREHGTDVGHHHRLLHQQVVSFLSLHFGTRKWPWSEVNAVTLWARFILDKKLPSGPAQSQKSSSLVRVVPVSQHMHKLVLSIFFRVLDCLVWKRDAFKHSRDIVWIYPYSTLPGSGGVQQGHKILEP